MAKASAATRRIKFKGWTPYMTARVSVAGYRPTADSRFAVARVSDKVAWDLLHVRSGMPVNSLLPALPRSLTLADKLSVAAAWEEASGLDWSAFDQLEELGPSSNTRQYLDPATAADTVAAMRGIAANILAV